MSHSHLACRLNVAYGGVPGPPRIRRQTHIGQDRHGDRWLAGALGSAAMAAARTKGDAYLGAPPLLIMSVNSYWGFGH
jgi:transposase